MRGPRIPAFGPLFPSQAFRFQSNEYPYVKPDPVVFKLKAAEVAAKEMKDGNSHR